MTEVQLASFLGRNRIEQGILVAFGQRIGQSAQTPLSPYLDIFFDSGAGPTVKNALQNPELLSMVIQLSALTFVHETDSLAQAFVESIDRNFKELKTDRGEVPDYFSLCGTLRVCKQDTAAFDWHPFHDVIMDRIEASLKSHRPSKRRGKVSGNQRKTNINVRQRPAIVDRRIPFSVFQTLLMCLHSLQHFPDERGLNVQCSTGITTVIVWCYYVFGLSVKHTIQGCEVLFGDTPANVFVNESSDWQSHASLLHPLNQCEPLFTLECAGDDPRISLEPRRNARGFGSTIVKELTSTGTDMTWYCNWVVRSCLRLLRDIQAATKSRSDYMESESHYRPWDNLAFGATSNRVLSAGNMLFDADHFDTEFLETNNEYKTPMNKHLSTLYALVLVLFSFAGVESDDLEKCGELPLSVQAFSHLKAQEYHVIWENIHLTIESLTSFNILSCLLQGPLYSLELSKKSILVSACGWSLYVSSILFTDPADVFDCTLRIVPGIPRRSEHRKISIVDGPVDLYDSKCESVTLAPSRTSRSIIITPDLSSVGCGRALVGFYDSHAF